jgi:hypothetical protein
MKAETKPGATAEPQGLLPAQDAAAIERLSSLLQETEHQHHGRPDAGWPRWYAAYLSQRQIGASVEAARVFADQYTVGQPT